ncbi:MFS transporter [Clostridium sp.]|uniref:MFS transporter n=1 Tax=Clostridium sp. TaxID=1506 RepID=UPI00261656E2|nr:MFS transporter [Clostridium sp.]
MIKLNKTEKSWALYDWANSAYSMTITSTILPLYFKQIYENSGGSQAMSTAFWGYANSIGTLIIAILAPVLGTIADYKGYKMKFFNIFLFIGIVFTGLLAAVPAAFWSILLLFYILNSIGFSGSNIFYDAFLVDVTTEKRMDKVSTMGFALGYIGSTIPFIICMAIVILAQYNLIPISTSAACKISFVLTAIWWGLNTIPMIKNVKQVHGIDIEPKPLQSSFRRLGNTLRNIKEHEKSFLFLLSYFFYIDGVNTIITMATSYGSDIGISNTSLLVILLLTQFVAFPFSILYGNLAEKYKGKTMLYVGIIIYIFICLYANFIRNALDFWILAMLVGSSQGGIQALSRSYFGKLVPKEKSNEFFGFYNIFGKFAAILGPFLVGIVTQMTGKSNYGVLSLILLFIFGGIILFKVPDKDSKKENNLY